MSQNDDDKKAPNPFGAPAGAAPNPFGAPGGAAPNPFGAPGGAAPNPFGGGGGAAAPNPFGGGGGAAAPNPFGAGEPAANPFGGGAPAPPMNPRDSGPISVRPLDPSQPAPQPKQSAPAGGGGAFDDIMGDSLAANPGGDDDLDSGLGLDNDSGGAPPPRKVRPEQQEWAQELPEGGGNEAADLAKAAPPRRPAARASAGGGAGKWLALAAVVLVLGVAGMFGKRFLDTKKAEEVKAAAKANQQSEADQLAALGIKPENAPACWTRDRGFKFSYINSSGTDVIVDSIGDVPVLYRSGARCIPSD